MRENSDRRRGRGCTKTAVGGGGERKVGRSYESRTSAASPAVFWKRKLGGVEEREELRVARRASNTKRCERSELTYFIGARERGCADEVGGLGVRGCGGCGRRMRIWEEER